MVFRKGCCGLPKITFLAGLVSHLTNVIFAFCCVFWCLKYLTVWWLVSRILYVLFRPFLNGSQLPQAFELHFPDGIAAIVFPDVHSIEATLTSETCWKSRICKCNPTRNYEETLANTRCTWVLQCVRGHFWMFPFCYLDINKVKKGNKTKKNHPENLRVNKCENTRLYDNHIW